MNSDISTLITQYAGAAGVPPDIALKVATQESGGNQYNADGSLVTGSSGEIGVFQLMPATAAQLGVDPTDPEENVQGGITYLQQLYAQFGNWPAAVAAFNAGPGNVARGTIPSSTVGYVNAVLSGTGLLGGSTSTVPAVDLGSLFTGTPSGTAVPLAAIAVGLVGLLVIWWLVD